MRNCCVDDCPFPSWGKDRNTGLPYCNNHQYLRTDRDTRTSYQKHMDKVKKHGQQVNVKTKVRGLVNSEQNKLVQNQAAVEINDLQKWYDDFAVIIEADPYCDECRTFIPKRYYRAASAHCLPKRKEYGFPSVKLHPDNRLKLGAGCGCHFQYDKSWEDAAKMKIWNRAVLIFLILYPFIDKSERKNIPEILRQELEPNE